MGKILETFGTIDGYDITIIGKLKAKKDDIFEEIEKIDSNIKEEVREIVNSDGGMVYAIVKKKIIKGIYVLKIEIKNDKRNLKLEKVIYCDEVSEETRNKYDEYIIDMSKDEVAYEEYDKVIFKDKIIQIDSQKSKKDIKLAMLGGFAIGAILGWVLFNDIAFAIMWGCILSPTFSGLEVVISKKREKKEKTENKDK